jgi:hypothetical protein
MSQTKWVNDGVENSHKMSRTNMSQQSIKNNEITIATSMTSSIVTASIFS